MEAAPADKVIVNDAASVNSVAEAARINTTHKIKKHKWVVFVHCETYTISYDKSTHLTQIGKCFTLYNFILKILFHVHLPLALPCQYANPINF